MSIFDLFLRSSKKSAAAAKERLQIVVSHERIAGNSPEFIQKLHYELLEVISKYVAINKEQIQVNLQQAGNCSVLELNVTLPNINNPTAIKEEATS